MSFAGLGEAWQGTERSKRSKRSKRNSVRLIAVDEREALRFLAGEELLDELQHHGTITIYVDRDTQAFGHNFRAGESVTIRPYDPEPAAVAQALDAAMEASPGGDWRSPSLASSWSGSASQSPWASRPQTSGAGSTSQLRSSFFEVRL